MSLVCHCGGLHFLGGRFPHQNLILAMGIQQCWATVTVQLDWTHITVLYFLPIILQGKYINILFCSNAETLWITWCLGLFLEFLTWNLFFSKVVGYVDCWDKVFNTRRFQSEINWRCLLFGLPFFLFFLAYFSVHLGQKLENNFPTAFFPFVFQKHLSPFRSSL